MVPNDWCIVNLKDVTTKIQDGNYGADYPKKEELLPSGIPFLTSKVLGGDGKINASKYDFISSEKHVSLKKAQITTDDILFTNRGANVGVVAVAGSDLADANIGPQLTLIRVDRNLSDNDYLYFFMKSPFFQRQVKGQDSGSAMNFFGIKATEKFKIILPPLPEQRKIAKILSTWDKAIRTTERLIDNSKQQKKALMQQLLSGKKRLLDDSGKPFEGEWVEYYVKEFGLVVTGNTPSKSDEANYGTEFSWATAEDFRGKYVSNTNIKLSSHGVKSARLVPKGSVLVTCIASIGKNAIANEELATNQQINAIKVNKKHCNEFLYYQIENNRYKLIAWAGTTAVPILNKSSFEKIKLKAPSIIEQKKIASVLSNSDKEIEVLQQQLADLKKEKKALMQQLLTGKRRVLVDEKEVA